MSGPPVHSRLGDVLVDAGVLTREQLQRALSEQAAWGGRLGQVLLNLGLIQEGPLASAIARQLGLPVVDLDRLRLAPELRQLLPLEIAERFGIMPLGRRQHPNRLLLACFDPTQAEGLQSARQAAAAAIEVYVAPASAIERAIRRVYYGEAAPAAIPGAGTFTVTRNTRDPSDAGTMGEDVVDRVTELEREVEKLKQLVDTLIRPKPH